MGSLQAWEFGVELTTHRKYKFITKCHKRHRSWNDSLDVGECIILK
jgi:hypothetical protein